MTAVAQLEEALAALHRAVGTIRAFVVHHTATAEDSSTNASLGQCGPVFDAFLRYARSVASAATSDNNGATDANLASVPALAPRGGETDEATFTRRRGTTEVEHLRQLVDLLVQQVADELSGHDSTDGAKRRLTDQLEALRLDAAVTTVYQGRVRELLSLLGHQDQATSERLTSIAVQPRAVDEARTETALVATELGRLTANMKDKLNRVVAENAKLHADRGALLAENALLFARVEKLEQQLSTMAASASGTLKELDRSRQRFANSKAALTTPPRRSTTPSGAKASNTTAHSTAEASAPTTLRIGDVVIDRNVALWMKDMYAALLADAETRDLVPVAESRDGQPRDASRLLGTADLARVARASSAGKARPAAGGGGGTEPSVVVPRGSFADHVKALRGEATPQPL
jgi:hypothetical protein